MANFDGYGEFQNKDKVRGSISITAPVEYDEAACRRARFNDKLKDSFLARGPGGPRGPAADPYKDQRKTK
jgi:hypothetical protein